MASKRSTTFSIVCTTLALPSLVFSQGGQLSEVISEQAMLYTECTNLIATCPGTIASCATYICAGCTGLGDKPLNSCCEQTSVGPEVCLSTYFYPNGAGAVTITSPSASAATTVDPNASACLALSVLDVSCESATPGFNNLPNTDQASCFCYNSAGSWIPDTFDSLASSCAAFAQTADVSDYPAFSSIEGFCSSVGNILSSGGSTMGGSAASTTPASPAASPTTVASQTAAAGTSASSGSAAASATQSSQVERMQVSLSAFFVVSAAMLIFCSL